MKKSSSNAYQAPAVLQWLDIELEEPITVSTKTGGQEVGDDPGEGDEEW